MNRGANEEAVGHRDHSSTACRDKSHGHFTVDIINNASHTCIVESNTLATYLQKKALPPTYMYAKSKHRLEHPVSNLLPATKRREVSQAHRFRYLHILLHPIRGDIRLGNRGSSFSELFQHRRALFCRESV